MSKIIDITVMLDDSVPVWPGTAGVQVIAEKRVDNGDQVNDSRLACGLHVGTHVDAPWHHLAQGDTVEKIALDPLLGLAMVVHLPNATAIDAEALAELNLPPGLQRLLFRTSNSRLWHQQDRATFHQDYVALTLDGARWIVKRGIRLIGIDYLSAQRFGDDNETHRVLLGAGVVILEGIDLSDAVPGLYELLCLPLKLAGAEAAPARAVLRPAAEA